MGNANRVGVLCECSGTVRDAFIRRGYDAISCDLKPTRLPGPHLQGDLWNYDWDGFGLLIMHPDCTFLAGSGLHWNARTPGRQDKTTDSISFVRRLMEIKCLRYALENPVGILSTEIRPADQIIQPHEFGDDASKNTCLWLKRLPKLIPTGNFPPRVVEVPFDEPRLFEGDARQVKRWSNQTDSGQNKLAPSEYRKELRSNTYPGIAAAMADQWGPLLTA